MKRMAWGGSDKDQVGVEGFQRSGRSSSIRFALKYLTRKRGDAEARGNYLDMDKQDGQDESCCIAGVTVCRLPYRFDLPFGMSSNKLIS